MSLTRCLECGEQGKTIDFTPPAAYLLECTVCGTQWAIIAPPEEARR